MMSGKSKYYEIKEDILTKIENGYYPPGSLLPAEPELEVIYRASRGTIRQALSMLVNENVITRRSGIGTTVVGSPKQPTILSFTDQVRSVEKIPTNRVLRKFLMSPEELVHPMRHMFFEASDDKHSKSIICIDRLRCADDSPVARQIVYLRAANFQANLLETEDFSGSLFVLYERAKLKIGRADEVIEARLPTNEEITLLEMDALLAGNQFVYVRNRATYDDTNAPLELLTSIERSDFFKSYRYQLRP